MTDERHRGELTEAILEILRSGTSRAGGRHHYAHVRSPRRLEDLLGIVAPGPAPSFSHRKPIDRPRGGKT